ncbi:DUF2666 domain-containing protein [Candidatus Micrarchaeota archaeon]|nr:DUF2666 domain-containing protein [Candidatus Micrarchaeota archaeon]
MDGNDEIIFTGAYRDFSLGIRFDLSGRKPEEVAGALAYISASIEPHAFRFSGIDTKKIDEFAKPAGNGLAAAYGFLEAKGPGGVKDALLKAVPDANLLPAAESYFFSRLLSGAGVPFKVAPTQAARPEQEKIEDFIGFVGKFGPWIAIKKLGLEKVQDYEVSGILAGINHTVVNKAFDFAGVKKDDAIVASAAGGKRRSYGNVALVLREIEQKMGGDSGDAYLVCKALETIGYKPYASPEMLSVAHPDIKPPKVRGRKPKG